MTAVNGVTGTSSVQDISSTGMGDIQLEFAKLQMELANTNKSDAMNRISKIKEQQKQTKDLVDLINNLRTSLGGETKDDAIVHVSESLARQCSDYGVRVEWHEKVGELKLASLKAIIQSLEAKKDTIGSDIQQEMVLIQDSMGKYSAYTNGATSQISKFSDTLASVARGQ